MARSRESCSRPPSWASSLCLRCSSGTALLVRRTSALVRARSMWMTPTRRDAAGHHSEVGNASLVDGPECQPQFPVQPVGCIYSSATTRGGTVRATWLATAGLIAPTSPSLPLTNRAGDTQPLDWQPRRIYSARRAAGPPLCPPSPADRPPHPSRPPQMPIAISNFSPSARSCSSSDAPLEALAGGRRTA